ncbi:MAG: NADH-quinone oxidoreductase subunit N [Silvanigrellales bacterium]|nr:NADH-quinone oxidoreductase subunit N [Silvanigrellales bacterium]
MEQLVQARLQEILPSAGFYLQASPILLLLVGALAALLLGVFRADPEKPNFTSLGVAVVSLVAAAAMPLVLRGAAPAAHLGSGFLADGLSRFSFVVIALGTLFTLFSAALTEKGRQLLRPELVCLLMFSSAGLMVMTSSGEFLTFFTGLEITSVSLYVLVGYQRQDVKALEAALKYFLLGATAAAIILMGMALVYLHVGSLRWSDMGTLRLSPDAPFALMGMFLVLCGLAFKLAIAPFHSWAPDVYQASHSTLTGYMATLVKFSVALVVLRILGASVAQASSNLVLLFWVLGALSIAIGSTFGLVHNSVKRMLAYSSVANAGYFCLAFAALAANPSSVSAREALTAYAAVYTVLNLGAFAVLAWLEDGNNEDLLKEELSGLGSKSPFAALALTVFLFGLAGIPPAAGFFGKFMLINAAVSEGLTGLAILMVLFSVVSLFYYLSLMVEMWLKPASRNSIAVTASSDSGLHRLLIGTAVVVSLVIGVVGPRWASMLDYTVATEAPSVAIGVRSLHPTTATASSDPVDAVKKKALDTAAKTPRP